MYAETIDTGAHVSVLRAFGPPDVVELEIDDTLVHAVLKAEGFWTVVRAVSVFLGTGDGVSGRFPQLTWRAHEDVPFAVVRAPFQLDADLSAQYTFAVGAQAFGQANGPLMTAAIPELVLLPGWTLALDVDEHRAGDILTAGRAYVQRYQLVDLDDVSVS